MTQQTLGLIGVGAFGAFITPHLAPHFRMTLHDPFASLDALAAKTGATVGSLAAAAACDIVVLAIPIQQLEKVLPEIVPHLQADALVLDVTSVKMKPLALLRERLPATVSIVGTHPLFGPQSGKNGIVGMKMAVCEGRGGRAVCVQKFLEEKCGLQVFSVTAEEHDREMAYVQGLTHLLAKIVVGMDLPDFQLTTKTYDYLLQTVGMVRHDSDDLFRAIARENPFAAEAKKAFFGSARRLENNLMMP